MCTTLLAGKNATVSGSVLFGANDDWDNVPGVLTHVPRCTHAPGTMYRLVGGYEIPELPETHGYSYTACHYDIGFLDKGWAGGVNDRQVAAAGTGASAFKTIPWEGHKLEPDDVQLLILRRANSAREGIRIVTDLIAEYGFGPSGLDDCASMATYAIADPEEAWWLEIAPGNHWIATRVPDDEVSVRPNAFGTHNVDLTDKFNVMHSPGLAEYAREQGWWDGEDTCFDWATAYGADVSPNEWGPELDKMNMLRRWRAMELFSGEKSGEDELLYSVKPNRKLTKQDFINVFSDVYDGTKYDLRKTPQAGKYGDPFTEDAPEYAISRRGTVASIVVELDREKDWAHMWTCMATPRMGVYMPLYSDIDSLPEACMGFEPCENAAPSFFWEWKQLCFLIQRRYAPHMEQVRPAMDAYEAESTRLLAEADEKMAALSGAERRRAMTEFTAERIEAARTLRKELQAQLCLNY